MEQHLYLMVRVNVKVENEKTRRTVQRGSRPAPSGWSLQARDCFLA